jgi:hypothetical protein
VKVLAIYVTTLEPEYSRSGVFFAADPGEKIFVRFPSSKKEQIQKIFELKRNFGPHDACVVLMSPNHLLSPLFRLLTNFQIILDAGWPLSDSTQLAKCHQLPLKRLLNKIIDKTSFTAANKIILESKAQINSVNMKLRIPELKLFDLFTGFNSALKNPEIPIECVRDYYASKPFVFFRGKYNSESGLDLIVDVARFLHDEALFVLVTNTTISDCPKNVLLINRFVSQEELSWLYENSILVIGQISDSARLKKTLPHKLFEAGFFSKCYISPPSPALFELLNEESFIPVHGINLEGLLQSIKLGLSNKTLRNNCEKNINENYMRKSSQQTLGLRMREIIELKI